MSARPVRSPGPRRPGRPRGGDAAVRETLLETARQLFLERGYDGVGIREIAAAARSSPATIAYHFGDKLGLYRAMLESAIAPVAAHLQSLGDGAEAGAPELGALAAAYGRVLASNPWVPALIVREVLTGTGPFREVFIEQFAGRLAPLLVSTIARGQAAGRLRADLDPRLVALSTIGLIVFPYLAMPVASRVFGIGAEDPGVERLARHTTTVLLEGLSPRGAH
ncbi:MAG: TetR/AcrR family transcriptional regulator [Steroidobacteraceae bacterium]